MNFRNRKAEAVLAVQAITICAVTMFIMFGMVLCFA